MNRVGVLILAGAVAAIVTLARGGHEVPIYPSFYPHEIEIRTLAPDQAADALLRGTIQAQLGTRPHLSGPLPDRIRAIESLGAFVVVHVNPQSHLAADEACAAVKRVARQAAEANGVVPHPYPVTPFHGDYLHHADRIEATSTAQDTPPAKVEVVELDALMVGARKGYRGWSEPPWMLARPDTAWMIGSKVGFPT